MSGRGGGLRRGKRKRSAGEARATLKRMVRLLSCGLLISVWEGMQRPNMPVVECTSFQSATLQCK